MKTLAVAGCFADFRIVRGRKVAAIVVEIPLEHADAALRTLGGLPNPASERWVGIAPLNGDPSKAEPEAAAPPDKRKWDDLPASQQSAIRCGEPEFQRFLGVTTSDEAAQKVRARCAVESRIELSRDARATAKWREIEDAYWIWRHDPRRAA